MTSQSTPAHHSGDHVVKTRYLMMVLDEPPNIFNILAWIFMWIVLAGFLVLPSSFPQIEEHVNPSNQLAKVVNFTQNIPLYVFFFPLSPLFDPRNGFSYSFSNIYLFDIVGFIQQIGTWHGLLHLRWGRPALGRPAPFGQLRLASQQNLHPRDVQWPLRLNHDVREHP